MDPDGRTRYSDWVVAQYIHPFYVCDDECEAAAS